jgi:hypothetical protein
MELIVAAQAGSIRAGGKMAEETMLVCKSPQEESTETEPKLLLQALRA